MADEVVYIYIFIYLFIKKKIIVRRVAAREVASRRARTIIYMHQSCNSTRTRRTHIQKCDRAKILQ